MTAAPKQRPVLSGCAQLEVPSNLASSGLDIENADFAMVAKMTVDLDTKAAHQTMKLIEALEELDDVQRVCSNAHFTNEAPAKPANNREKEL